MIVKILENSVYRTEPSVLIDDSILINAPEATQGLFVDAVLLTHTHKENLKGLSSLRPRKENSQIKVFVAREHEHFLKFHCDCSHIQINHIVPGKEFKFNDIKVKPITSFHEVQKMYGSFCLGFMLNDKIGFFSPCHTISVKYIEDLVKMQILFIDGGYRSESVFKDHSAMYGVMKDFENFPNLNRLYFLGTRKGQKINGKLKHSHINVGTLQKRDVIFLKNF